MKIALCLSGQSRFTVKNFPVIRDNLITPTGADVFFHHWDTEDASRGMEPQTAFGLYSPKKYIIEPQRAWPEEGWDHIWERLDPQHASKDKHQRKVQNDHSMLYSRMKVNHLKSQYEKEKGFKYDCVIRARTDLLFGSPFDPEEFRTDPSSLWVWFVRDRERHGVACCDLFAFGNSKIMDVYSEFFSHYLDTAMSSGYLYVEALLLDYLREAGVDLKFSKTLLSVHNQHAVEKYKFFTGDDRAPARLLCLENKDDQGNIV